MFARLITQSWQKAFMATITTHVSRFGSELEHLRRTSLFQGARSTSHAHFLIKFRKDASYSPLSPLATLSMSSIQSLVSSEVDRQHFGQLRNVYYEFFWQRAYLVFFISGLCLMYSITDTSSSEECCRISILGPHDPSKRPPSAFFSLCANSVTNAHFNHIPLTCCICVSMWVW